MVKTIVEKRERVPVKKDREANQYRHQVPPAPPDQFAPQDQAKRQAHADGNDLDRRGERSNEMQGATECGEADEAENARVPDLHGDSQEPSQAEPVSQTGDGGAHSEWVSTPDHARLSAAPPLVAPMPLAGFSTKPILQ